MNYKLFVLIIVLSIISISCSSSAPALYDTAPGSGHVLSETPELARTSAVTTDNRMIAYNITLDLSVKNTEDTRSILIEQVNANGGYIVRESNNQIVARIPAANADNYIEHAKTLGKTENESKTGNDITEQYRNNTIRLDSLKNVRNRYLALLERANTVSEILSIERELERVNTEIDLLEGRIRAAEQSVAYSSVTVRFYEKAKPGPVSWIFYGLYQGIRWLFVWN